MGSLKTTSFLDGIREATPVLYRRLLDQLVFFTKTCLLPLSTLNLLSFALSSAHRRRHVVCSVISLSSTGGGCFKDAVTR